MRGEHPGGTKVVRCRHDAPAKIPLPDPVYVDARRERMVRPRKPLGKCPAITTRLGIFPRWRNHEGFLTTVHHTNHARWHCRPRFFEFSSQEKVLGWSGSKFPECRDRLVLLFCRLCLLLDRAQPRNLLPRRLVQGPIHVRLFHPDQGLKFFCQVLLDFISLVGRGLDRLLNILANLLREHGTFLFQQPAAKRGPDRVDLCRRLVDLLLLLVVVCINRCLLTFRHRVKVSNRHVFPFLWINRRGKDSNHAVVICMGNRVELVRVTLGTVNGHPQQVTGDHLDRIEQDTSPDICRVQFLLACRVCCLPEKTGCHQVPANFRRVLLCTTPVDEFIARQLLSQELVIRHVAIEGIHHVIPVTPFPLLVLDNAGIVIDSHHVRVTSCIKPAAGPSLSKSSRGK